MFLEEIEKEQQKNQKIFAKIESNIDNYAKNSTSTSVFKTKNKKLPVRGKVFQPFGNQNKKIAFYHENRSFNRNHHANESVRAVTKGKVVFCR